MGIQEVIRNVPVPQVHTVEKIVEVPQVQTIEKVIEVPQVQVVEKVMPVPQVVTQEVVRQIPRVMTQEVVRQVPKIMVQEVVRQIAAPAPVVVQQAPQIIETIAPVMATPMFETFAPAPFMSAPIVETFGAGYGGYGGYGTGIVGRNWLWRTCRRDVWRWLWLWRTCRRDVWRWLWLWCTCRRDVWCCLWLWCTTRWFDFSQLAYDYYGSSYHDHNGSHSRCFWISPRRHQLWASTYGALVGDCKPTAAA